MKIGRESIGGLTQKNTVGGLRYYWEPTPKQRAAGWKTLTLPADLAGAVTAAKRRNAELDEWQLGGARPATIRRFVRAQTFDAVLDRYEREVLVNKRDNTQRVDRTAIKRLREWAGAQPWHWISRARVRALREAMMRHAVLDGPGHAPAFHLLTTLRKILAWHIRDQDLKVPNPADHFGLPAPAPRDHLWERDAQAAMVEAAIELGWASIDFAFEIATYTGQREADILHLQRSHWREIGIEQLEFDQDLYDALKSDRGPDTGKVMGLYVRQSKGKRWVGVPIEGALRDRIEAAIAANVERARAEGRVAAQHIIVNDQTSEPWGQSNFIHRFLEVKQAAVAVAIMRGDEDLAERLDALQYRDLRRTCIVTLGLRGLNDYMIASITGHKQATIKRILEVYMPRTEAAAARGVVARIGPREAAAKVTDTAVSRNSD